MNSYIRRRLKPTAYVNLLITNQFRTPIVKPTCRSRRGTKGGKTVIRTIRTVVSVQRKIKQNHDVCVNTSNLDNITLSNNTEEKCIFPYHKTSIIYKKTNIKVYSLQPVNATDRYDENSRKQCVACFIKPAIG